MKNYDLIGDQELENILGMSQAWALIAFTSWGSIPCGHFRPELEAVAAHIKEKVYCAEVIVDENPTISEELGIKAVPTTLLLLKGEEIKRFEGPYSHEALIDRITPLLKATP